MGEEKEEWPAIGNLGEERKEGSAAAAGRSRKGKEKRRRGIRLCNKVERGREGEEEIVQRGGGGGVVV